ncbi:MAG: hypothetical protein ACJA2W_003376 [Planctomycetota bacterium]|jgi:hypothetical protein
MIRALWIAFCTLAGCAIGAALGSAAMGQLGLALGLIIGGGLGWLFGRFISISDALG